MAGGPHQGENAFACAGAFKGFKGGAYGSPGIIGDVWKKGGVSIEIFRFLQTRQVLGGMRAKQNAIIKLARFPPDNGHVVLRPELLQGFQDARRPLGMARKGITDATFVGDDFHVLCPPQIEFIPIRSVNAL